MPQAGQSAGGLISARTVCQGSEEAGSSDSKGSALGQGCCFHSAVGAGLASHTPRFLETHLKSLTTPPWQPDARSPGELQDLLLGVGHRDGRDLLETRQSETRCAHCQSKAVGVGTCLVDETGHQASPGHSPEAQPGWRL